MATGDVAFTGNTGLAVYLKQVHERPIPPSRSNPTITKDVEHVILRALDKDPRRRYQTPHALAHAYLQAVSAAGPLQEIGSGRTPVAMSRVVLNDTGEMPPLYEVGEELPQDLGARHGLAEPGFGEVDVPFVATSFVTPSPVPIEEEKLVLPAYAHDAGAPAASSPAQTLIQQPGRLTPPIARQVPAELTRTGSARYNRNIFAVTSFMGISFLLIIMSIILFAVFDYNSNKLGERTPAATARATHPSQPTRVNTAQAKDTSTPVANVTPLASEQQAVADERAITSGTPLLVDDLSSSVISSWNVDDNNCIFIGGTYHVIAKQANFLVPCESNILTYDNAAFQVDVSLLSGSMAGLVFSGHDQQFYDFGIT